MYQITRDYIRKGNSRSGQRIAKVRFIVSHDTGNTGSTAYNNHNYFNKQQPSASAHTFIDDQYILEIIPITEKAWHVQYNKPKDNQLFGADSNDAAIGVELCWGGKIDFNKAYKRYVWYHAYLCKKFNLNPRKHIVGHYTLDPERRSDPLNAFKRYGITWKKFIDDVAKDFNVETSKQEPPKQVQPKPTQPKKEEDDMLERAVVYNSLADIPIAEEVAGRLNTVTVKRTVAERVQVAKELIVVGGSKNGLKADKFTVLSGEDRFETTAKVAAYLK